MSRIPCEMIRDLLPSYIDELTNDVTNKEIEEHIKECCACEKALQEMRAPEIELPEPEAKEIDFLKKTKQKQKRNLVIGIAVLCACVIAIFCGTYIFSGQYVNTEYLSYNLDVYGPQVAVAISTTSDQGIQKIEFDDADGIVEIKVRCVPKSFVYPATKSAKYAIRSDEYIRQIKIGDRIVWSDGEMISPLTSALYESYNPYIGDMSANGDVIRALNMTAYTGNFKNELQTSKEPYAWKMIFENQFSTSRQSVFEERLRVYAYMCLAEIGNLNEVIYEYNLDGETVQLSVTSDEASEYAGADIKEVGKDINLLEKLVAKTGLSNVVLGGASVESEVKVDDALIEKVDDNVYQFPIYCQTEGITGIELEVECDGHTAKQSMTAPDNGTFARGENVVFQLLPEDFAGDIKNGSQAIVRLKVTDQNGHTSESINEVCVLLYLGNSYRIGVDGNAKDGYDIGQIIVYQ